MIDYRDVFRASPSPYLLLSPAFEIMDASEAYLAATHTTRAAIVGRDLFEVFPNNPDEPTGAGPAELRASLARVLATRVPDAMPVVRNDIPRPALHGGFEARWWKPFNAPVLGPDGGVTAIVHHVEDVTAVVRSRADTVAAEDGVVRLAALLLKERGLRERVMEAEPVALVFADHRLVVRLANRAFLAIAGRPEGEVLHQPLEAVTPGSHAALACLMRGALAAGREAANEAVPTPGAEAEAHWDFRALPLFDGEAIAIGVLGVGLEVSDRVANLKAHERRIEELQEADRLKDEFFDTISHELRTPIHVMMGFVDVLARGAAGDVGERQRGYLAKMREVADRLSRLVEEILVMGQLRAGSLQMAFEAAEVRPIMAETLALHAPLADARGQALHEEVPADLPRIRADARWIGQALGNLVQNAVKFTPSGGTIRVAARVDGGRVRVEVMDTGPGISPADQARVFERFSQVETGRTRAHDGVGLGLAIAREIVEAHGGAIGVESVPGAGSTFWIALPVAA